MMTSAADQNALAEMALALAMAFFAIMVLALVSMGAEVSSQAQQAMPDGAQARLAEPAKDQKDTGTAAQGQTVIWYKGLFMDPELKPVDPAALSGPDLVLAVPPDASMADVLLARAAFGNQDPRITTLDARWTARLEADQ